MATESQERSNRLVHVIHCLTAGKQHRVVPCGKVAYREGSSTHDLLATIDTAPYLRDVPTPLQGRVWRAVHERAWVAARRQAEAQIPASRAPGAGVASKLACGSDTSGAVRGVRAGYC